MHSAATGFGLDDLSGACKNYSESVPEVVALAKKLHRYPVNGQRRSLREISRELAAAGHLSQATPYGAAAVARMIGN